MLSLKNERIAKCFIANVDCKYYWIILEIRILNGCSNIIHFTTCLSADHYSIYIKFFVKIQISFSSI